jgi:t-SNARE complex subunit (syntaxin)
MARKRKEITDAELNDLLHDIANMLERLQEVNEAIDNHIPDMEVGESATPNCLWIAIEANKLVMRLQSIRRNREREKELARLMG